MKAVCVELPIQTPPKRKTTKGQQLVNSWGLWCFGLGGLVFPVVGFGLSQRSGSDDGARACMRIGVVGVLGVSSLQSHLRWKPWKSRTLKPNVQQGHNTLLVDLQMCTYIRTSIHTYV